MRWKDKLEVEGGEGKVEYMVGIKKLKDEVRVSMAEIENFKLKQNKLSSNLDHLAATL